MNPYRVLTVIMLLAFSLVAYGQQSAPSAIDVVNLRMNHYNNHDFDAFISLYSPDIEIYDYPDMLINTGIPNLTSIFKPKFEKKSIQVEILNQIVHDTYVINQEIVTEEGKKTNYISIYEVKDGLITSVRFVRE